ncbi:hypothetical protein Peur_003217 [Populus x canadensis]
MRFCGPELKLRVHHNRRQEGLASAYGQSQLDCVLGIDLENTESFVRSSCMYAVCEVRDVLFQESAKSHFELYKRRVPDLSRAAFVLREEVESLPPLHSLKS